MSEEQVTAGDVRLPLRSGVTTHLQGNSGGDESPFRRWYASDDGPPRDSDHDSASCKCVSCQEAEQVWDASAKALTERLKLLNAKVIVLSRARLESALLAHCDEEQVVRKFERGA